jgi:hypothetical protein
VEIQLQAFCILVLDKAKRSAYLHLWRRTPLCSSNRILAISKYIAIFKDVIPCILVTTYQSTWCPVPQDSKLHSRYCKNLWYYRIL